MNSYLIFGIGLLAQLLYFGRTILQWFKSENEGEVISPVIFWKISLAASVIMMFYGIFRHDPVILLGQIIVYFIYVRNLQLKNAWAAVHPLIKSIIIVAPFVLFLWLLTSKVYTIRSIVSNQGIPPLLMAWGISGQLIFSFRFVFQWIHSEVEKESVLPLPFWIISTAGALITLIYAIFRTDPILFVSNGLGLFIYVRNILIYGGRKGLFNKMNNERFNRIAGKISGKIT